MRRAAAIFSLSMAVLAIVLACAGLVFAREVPDLAGRVTDTAAVLSPEAKLAIEKLSEAIEKSDTTQIAVLTVESLEGDTIEQLGIKAFEKWKIGQKGKDNGVIVLLAKKERKIRIEVGRGLELKFTDLVSGRIIAEAKPHLKSNMGEGLLFIAEKVATTVKGEYKAAPVPEEKGEGHALWEYLRAACTIALILTIACLALVGYPTPPARRRIPSSDPGTIRSSYSRRSSPISSPTPDVPDTTWENPTRRRDSSDSSSSSGSDTGWSGGGGDAGGGGASGDF